MADEQGARWSWIAGGSAAIVLAAMGVLTAMGRAWWCPRGDLVPWSFDIWSVHNSQHLLDPYSFTHVLHGILFFAILRLVGDRWFEGRWLFAVAAEAVWEIVENTDTVIEHYREATISLEYYGDSVPNSGADIVAMMLGYTVASRLPWWGSLGVFVVTEVVLALWIRDSLVLNIVMLVWPIEAIKTWQLGA